MTSKSLFVTGPLSRTFSVLDFCCCSFGLFQVFLASQLLSGVLNLFLLLVTQQEDMKWLLTLKTGVPQIGFNAAEAQTIGITLVFAALLLLFGRRFLKESFGSNSFQDRSI